MLDKIATKKKWVRCDVNKLKKSRSAGSIFQNIALLQIVFQNVAFQVKSIVEFTKRFT